MTEGIFQLLLIQVVEKAELNSYFVSNKVFHCPYISIVSFINILNDLYWFLPCFISWSFFTIKGFLVSVSVIGHWANYLAIILTVWGVNKNERKKWDPVNDLWRLIFQIFFYFFYCKITKFKGLRIQMLP